MHIWFICEFGWIRILIVEFLCILSLNLRYHLLFLRRFLRSFERIKIKKYLFAAYWCSSLQPTKSRCISWYQNSSYFSWMGRSNHLADMNEVHVRIKTARKEQLATWWQHTEEQLTAMRDQFEAFPTWLSNIDGYNKCHHWFLPHVSEEEDKHDDGYKSEIPYAEHRMKGR